MKTNAQTVAEGLSLNEEWALINRHRIEKEVEKNDTVSDTILNMMHSMREEELGTTSELSSYEKKLVMMGFHLAQVILQKQQQSMFREVQEALNTLQEIRKSID